MKGLILWIEEFLFSIMKLILTRRQKTLQELDLQIVTNHEYDIMMNRYKFVVLFPEGLADKVIEVMRKILTVG